MKKKMFRASNLPAVALALVFFVIAPTAIAETEEQIIIDHTCTNLSQIPDEWIDQAKSDLHIAYQHTSHGSQLITGMNALENFPDFGVKYEWSDNGANGLDLDDYGIPGCADLSQGDWIDGNGVTPWVTATRNLLDNPTNSHVNVVMWSWCNINGHNITRYLENMEILVSEYPNVTFVFMTGHSDGQGEGGFIHTANEQIRQHCIDNNRVLFDFADIEYYDPDENYYYDKPLWDNLDYTDISYRDSNWGIEWCDNNPGSELEQLTTGDGVIGYSGCGSCVHSGASGQGNTINCVLKGRATWWMMARISGWSGESEGNIIYVPDDHEKINWAIDNAASGDTIIVRDGSYIENVIVNKRLTIRSENGSESTQVNAVSSNDPVFDVVSDYVNISGFMLTGANSESLPYPAGIYLGNGVDNCVISANDAFLIK